MASRRMFSHAVVTTDKFQSLSRDSQFLYIHLGMHADDDGFLGSPLMLAKMVSCGKEALAELERNGYIISFPTGVCVITHWHRNNYIQKDRYTETVYQEEKSHLRLEDGVYRYYEEPQVLPDVEVAALPEAEVALPEEAAALPHPKRKLPEEAVLPDTEVPLSKPKACSTDTDTQNAQGEENAKTGVSAHISSETTQIVEESKKSVVHQKTEPKSAPLALGAYQNVYLSQEECEKLKREFPDYKSMIENLSRKIAMHGYRYKNHYAVLVEWAKQDAEKAGKSRAAPQNTRTSFRAQTMDTYQRMAEEIEKRQFEKTPQAVGG